MEHLQDSIKPFVHQILGYLAIRARSRLELTHYLERKTDNREIINDVLQYLDTHHLINDADFARAWAESRLKKHKGDLIIRQELRQKGIADNLIQTVLQEIEPEAWLAAIDSSLQKYRHKWQFLVGYQQKAQIYTLLRQRGFSSPHIDAFLRYGVK